MRVLLYIKTVLSIVFPTPTSKTPGWHPLAFEHEHISHGLSQRIEFVDSNYVLWKSGDKYHMRPDICPHQGAKLSNIPVTPDGCITCSYHGLKIGPNSESFKACRETFGRCKVSQGIIWWTPVKGTGSDKIPFCDKLEEEEKTTSITRFSTDIEGSFSDCFKNSMDFHHAAFVHQDTFGNYAGEPDLIYERWNTKGDLEGNFLYGSNDIYAKYTGGETGNSHVYCEPSTTYNIVTGKDGKFMIIYAAMRAITPTKTRWFLISCSNFVPSGYVGRIILERMTKKVANEEDGKQLRNMATDEEKIEHSFKFTLPLDSIYGAWNKKYESAEELEHKLLEATDTQSRSIIAQKLSAYNHSVDMIHHIRYTRWEMIEASHLRPGSTITEMFSYNTARETTTLKNGTAIEVRGDVSRITNTTTLIDNLVATIKFTPDSPKVPIPRLPFTKHDFDIYYVSNNIMLRMGVPTETWEMLKKID